VGWLTVDENTAELEAGASAGALVVGAGEEANGDGDAAEGWEATGEEGGRAELGRGGERRGVDSNARASSNTCS
jgi:hypothetical protein